MGEPKPDVIARLVQQGLDHYGMGETRSALRCWREALALDPSHAEAREYLQTVLEDLPEEERGDGEARARAPQAAPAARDVRVEAQRLLQAERGEEALALLETAAAREPERLELHGYIDLVRSRLLKHYRERLRLESGVPRLRVSGGEMLRYDLPPDAGFLLSLVDNVTPLKDLISVCGMDEFHALRLLARLVEQGLVEIRS